MAKTAKRKSKSKSVAHRSAPNKRKNPVLFIPKSHNRRKNPSFFGASVTPVKMGEYIAGGLIGLSVNRLILPMLPSSLTSSSFMAFIAAVALAGAEWWAASMIDKDFGASVGFGALMNAGNTALNSVLPSVGAYTGLSGRGVGDFVPGRFAVPQNPVLDAATGGMGTGGGMMHRAYPSAYGAAA